MQPVKLRWKDKPIQHRLQKVQKHFQKYVYLKGHVAVLINPSKKSKKFANADERLFSVRKQTRIAELQSMLKESLNNRILPTESIFFYIVVGDLYQSYFQNGDFLMVEYQQFQDLF